MLKRFNTFSLIYLAENKTPLILQKLKLNNRDIDYIMQSESVGYYYYYYYYLLLLKLKTY